MHHHEDGSVTLTRHEAEDVRLILDWIMQVMAATTFGNPQKLYVQALGLRGMLADRE